MQSLEPGDPTFRVLASSPVLSTFRNAFEEVTGLPVVLAGRGTVDWGRARPCTAICPNLKNGHPDCEGCLRFPESRDQDKPVTLQCRFGLVRTAVPLRANGEVVAYLWTGWISDDRSDDDGDAGDDWEPIRPSEEHPSRGDRRLGARRIVKRERYSAMVDILASFAAAGHPLLASGCSAQPSERCVAVARAIDIIAVEYSEEISLQSVARRCNVTASYFSGLFRRSMNATFTDYLVRFRVEKAKELLVTSEQRISEIADACGFGSHSQFNRMFHRLVGTSPRRFRAQSRSAA